MTPSTFPNRPKKYTLKEAVKIVTRCAKVYDQELKNKNLLFVYMVNDTVCYYEVSFFSTSYMHLTGLKSANSSQSATIVTNSTGKNSNGISPEKFYQDCLDNKLNAKDIAFPGGFSTPYTFLKLDVIESVINKNLSAIAIGDLPPTHKTLWADFVVGNDTACLGFVRKKGSSGGYVPISLLSGSYKKNIQNPSNIMITYRKNMSDQKYTEIVYVGKDANGNDIDWDSINFTGEYAYLPKPV